MKIRLELFLIIFIYLFYTTIATATVFTSTKDGHFEYPSTWDIGNGMIPGEMDTVIIKHKVELYLTSKVTIKSLSLSNFANENSGFEVYGRDSLVILDNFQATAHNIDKSIYIWIRGSATVVVEGNCHLLRVAENSFDKYFDFTVLKNAKFFIKGSLRFDYLGAGSNEGEKEIVVKDNGLLDVEGETVFINSGGEDFNLGLYNKGKVIFRDSLSLILNGTGKEAGITLHDSSSLQILSSAYLFNSSTASNDFAKLRARNESTIYIQDNIYMESYGAKVKLEAEEIGGVVTVGGDIVMNASAQDEASVNIINDGKVFLGGDIVRETNFGKLTMNDDGALILNGSEPQIIPKSKLPNSGTDSLFFKKIVLANTSPQPFVLTEDLIVRDSLVLTHGNLISDSSAMVVLEDNATISGSSTAYIEGPVKKIGSTGGQPLTLPIGTSTAYAPITISEIASPLSEITVQYASEPPPFGVEAFENDINNVSTNGFWTVEKNTNTGDVDLTLTWEDSAEIGITETADLVVAGWDGTEWISYGQESSGMIGAGGFVESSFSEPPPFGVENFTLASTSSFNSLPVDLKRFKATPRTGSVDLEWQTEAEINSSHFLVERSTDGINFVPIDFVKSKGDASTPAAYTVKDVTPSFGWNYYRLKMIDNDESYEYSPTEAIKLEKDASIRLYPNPVKDVLFIQDTEGVEAEVRVEIFDRHSSKVHEAVIFLNNGPVQLTIEDIQTLPSGYYIVKITGASGCQFVNFVIAE